MAKHILRFAVGLLLWLAASPSVFAQDTTYAKLDTSAELFVSSTEAQRHFGDASELRFGVSYLPDETVEHPTGDLFCPTVTQQVLLQFDLADIDVPIRQARLTLRQKTANPDAPLPSLSATLDNWDPSSATWHTRPLAHSTLGTYAVNDGATFTWYDDGTQNDSTLAEWLEYRRQSADSVTLLLDLPHNGHCWPFAPATSDQTIAFFDTASGDGPVLELFSAEPSAVSLQSSTITTYSRTLLLVALLVAFGTLYLTIMDD